MDSNGAGDAHAGGFLALLSQGLDPAGRRARRQRGGGRGGDPAPARPGPAPAPDRAEPGAFRAGDPLAERIAGVADR
ncbi:hypothetical protein [Streptomyces sp. NPDC101237]|uniref:hypothetical protein n=1 Tax=Streptomyces sp. NPDC101237 TaxID=3366139 RepID=UPI0037F746C1